MGAAGIILQARMASTRLPGKALEVIAGRSILERCLERLLLGGAAPVVLATTDRYEDDVLESAARRMGVEVFRGHPADVLDRYLRCAEQFRFELVIRATADNPGVDIEASSRVLTALAGTGAHYVHEQGLPYGAAVEGITRKALLTAAILARDPYDREHVTPFIRRRSDLFRTVQLTAPPEARCPDLRVTVDTHQDLVWLRKLYASAGSDQPTLGELIAAAGRTAVPFVA